MKNIWKAVLGLCAAGLLIAGCGGEKNTEPAEDTPWNHGRNAIMETEEGYYYNRSTDYFSLGADSYPFVGQHLKYWEKESGMSILLCNKPECQHVGGDDCEATYRGIRTVNSLLYDGSIYILGMDTEGDMVSINLYRAAPDGSAIDKVGTVIQAENLKGEQIYSPSTEDGFLIHKGCAYIPYYLRFGQASKTYMGGGLAKMDLKTGEVHTFYETKYVSSDFPYLDAAVGDYVYFHGSTMKRGYRYSISEDRVEETKAFRYLEDGEKVEYRVSWSAFSKDMNFSLYQLYGADTEKVGWRIEAYNAQTGEYVDGFDIDISPKLYDQVNLVCYEDKLMLTVEDTAYWYNRKGEKLAQIQSPVTKEGYTYSKDTFSFKVNNDKLYLILKNSENVAEVLNNARYTVYSCPLKDLFEGRGSWTVAFEMDTMDALEEEVPENAGN